MPSSESVTVRRPMVKARFTPICVPENWCKETKLWLPLWGFLQRYLESQLGCSSVFDNYVSIKTHFPGYLGFAVLYVGEVELNTELAGNPNLNEFKFELRFHGRCSQRSRFYPNKGGLTCGR
ncbi:hypothetical protein P692DRAFT_20820824 [Suillus brevipes Sb2]|nr:hypothetical protein P692DRAFT_20820824 [Suillus brevipes Sb2]